MKIIQQTRPSAYEIPSWRVAQLWRLKFVKENGSTRVALFRDGRRVEGFPAEETMTRPASVTVGRFGAMTAEILRWYGRRDRDKVPLRAVEQLYAKWGEKRVERKMEELTGRGYVEYGVSARSGWLTDKGKAALAEIESEAEESA